MYNDTFTKWILGLTASAIVVIGGALLRTILILQEDVAVMKVKLDHIGQYELRLSKLENIETEIKYRIGAIELELKDDNGKERFRRDKTSTSSFRSH